MIEIIIEMSFDGDETYKVVEYCKNLKEALMFAEGASIGNTLFASPLKIKKIIIEDINV